MNIDKFNKGIEEAERLIKDDIYGVCCAIEGAFLEYYSKDKIHLYSQHTERGGMDCTFAGLFEPDFPRGLYWLGELSQKNIDKRLFYLEMFAAMMRVNKWYEKF